MFASLPQVNESVVIFRTNQTEPWDPTKLLTDKDSFLMLTAIGLIVCILMIFFSILSCCLMKEKKTLGKQLNEQQSLIKEHNQSIQGFISELENIS